MKKIILSILTIVMISSLLIACGNTSETDKETPADEDLNPVVEEAEKDPSQAEDEKDGEDEMGAKLSKAYSEMMKNKKYLMKYNMKYNIDGQTLESEVTTAVSGDKTAVTNIANGVETTIISKDDISYMIDHTNKTVLEMPMGDLIEGMEEQIEGEELETEGLTYVSSGVEDGLDYEEYTIEDGKLRYYFDGDKLVKIVFDIDEEKQVMDIIEMSDKVNETMFEIPSDYKMIELPYGG